MAGKFTQLALLTAGLFLSTKSFAAGECLGFAGSVVTYLEFESSSCPVMTSQPQSGAVCELVRGDDFVCVEVASGGSGGGPWRYSGGLFEENDNEPIPAPPVMPPPPLDAPVWRPVDLEQVNTSSFASNTTNSLTNITNRLNSLTDFVSEDSNAIRTQLYSSTDKILQATSATNNHIFNNTQVALTGMELNANRVVNNQNVLVNNLNQKDEQRFEELKEKIDALSADGSNSDVLADLDALKILIENARYHAQNAAHNSDLANYNAQQAYIMASEAAENSGSVTGDISDIKSNTNEMLNLMLDGGTGGSGDMQQTNDILNGIKSDANNNTNRIVNAVNNSQALSNIENQLMQTNGKLGGLSGQLGQQLDEIKTAIENDSGSGGGNDDDTETNQKLDTLIQGTALVAQNTGATNDNLVQASQNIQSTISASGQQLTDSINGLGEKLVGIGEGIDGINDALQAGTGQKNGPATCEGKDCWKAASWIESSYPDGVAGLWQERKDAFDRSGMKQYLNSLVPQIGGNGGLKPFELCFDMGFAHYGCHAFTIPPYVIAFIRLCVLITAGFYCQRLVFGGA